MKKKLVCVLLVDDNDSDNFFHKRVIEKAGITDNIEIVINGKEAIDFLTSKGKCGQPESSAYLPELIFLDINMPVMDGWEFLEEYEKLDVRTKDKVVIIILTTSLNPVDKARVESITKKGSFQYKPLTLKMINEIVESHFPNHL
ncbi:MAG: response regulator [Bacteroidetes bacterium]|nr:response regulator [Bacteroidota bacterium]